MARTKSITSIETEMAKINGELEKLQKKQSVLSDRLLELQKLKQQHETKQIMDAFQKSGKSMRELMTFLEI